MVFLKYIITIWAFTILVPHIYKPYAMMFYIRIMYTFYFVSFGDSTMQ